MRIKEVNGFLKSILAKNIVGITLAPFGIYLDKDHMSDEHTINHEKIHWKQQVEMLIIPFYIWYAVEWLWKTIIYGKGYGYYCISFEREAYKNSDNLEYTKTRKPYSWVKELGKKASMV